MAVASSVPRLADGTRTVQGAARIHAALEKVTHPVRVNPVLVAAGVLTWAGFSVIVLAVPDSARLPPRELVSVRDATPFTAGVGFVVASVAALAWVVSAGHGRLGARAAARLSGGGAWLFGSALWAVFWQLSTAKSQLLSTPYFASPQAILDHLWTDRGILAESLGNSLKLLAAGFFLGLVAGLATGLVIGWSQVANYWVHPVLMFLGPVPTLAWVPVIFVLFPSAYTGAVFLIAVSVWFPITVLTRAGILSVPRSYYDVTQTLGADRWFLLLRVSLPAALPSILTGAFMALGASFVSLTVAENFGVNSGLGWYLNWQKGWGDFPGLYAGIVVLVLVCGILLSLLLRLRGWALRWERELTRW
ncbi:ABC transporter permease subunit [Kineosporia sp. J2-2]|uniref:ABC transporter permease subunit n=1 Tax=Kineosporia corallincola TaxID=2835133 RepID=A0ABS5TC97_9ACTN|nr:ABC transporter permease subunit [Kineosporia corallincola]MBT0768707.1 ABC transporter permease subunit [Kineosporia corallincola]